MKHLHAQSLPASSKRREPKNGKPRRKSIFLRVAPMVALGAFCACNTPPAKNPITAPKPKPVAESRKQATLKDFTKAHARDSKRKEIISALLGICVGVNEVRGESMSFVYVPIELTTCLDAQDSEEAAQIMESIFRRIDSLEKTSELNYDGIIAGIIKNHSYLETIRVLGSLFSHPHFSDELLAAFSGMMNPNPYCGYRYDLRKLYSPHTPYSWTACGYGGCSSGTDTDLDPLGEQATLHLQLMQGILDCKELTMPVFSDVIFVLNDLTGPEYDGLCTRDGYMDAIEFLTAFFSGKSFDPEALQVLVVKAHMNDLYWHLKENNSRYSR